VEEHALNSAEDALERETRATTLRRLVVVLTSQTVASRYSLACAAAIVVWLSAWLFSFHDIYGWLTDDIYQFQRVMMYERGGRNMLDIPWFHAYDWFIATLPWLFHWSIPSYMVPQVWARTGEFRAFILYTIVLHAIILAMIANLLHLVCKNRLVAFGALVLFMTSPTFVFYSDLLDSRYLGFLAGLPALILLLRARDTMTEPKPIGSMLLFFLLPGFLFGLGQSIQYTLTYFAGPVSAVYWYYAFVGQWQSRVVWRHFSFFVAGVALWFAPVQALSLCFHPFNMSMIGILLNQVDTLSSHYDKLSQLATWLHFFLEDMGVSMMVLVTAGALISYRDAWRPSYISQFHARLIFWSCFILIAYLVVTPSIAFYRQVALYQFFFMLFAMIAVDVWTKRLFPTLKVLRAAAVCTLFFLAAWVPSLARMPEVFVASQGLGRAVIAAHRAAAESHGKVYFIEFYDYDLYPLSIISRQDFDRLKPGDVIVTDFPTLFFVKYPDLFALLHDAGPIASFPTEWCTRENWVEERTYWNYRRYQDEPESCNAQVYRVSTIRKEEAGKPLRVLSVRADSEMSPQYPPSRVFAIRSPAVPMDMTDCCNAVPAARDLWASDGNTRKHWLQITFAHPTRLHAVTVVPTNYFSPPGWNTVARPQFVAIYGTESRNRVVKLWQSGDLRNAAIFTANFEPTIVKSIRIAIQQPPVDDQRHAIMFYQRLSPSPVAAIEYIAFPGYVVHYRAPG
jgi:hypothetical protein